MSKKRKNAQRLNRSASIFNISLLTIFTLLVTATPAHADPLLLETGIVTGSVWYVLIIGLSIETIILTLVTRRLLWEIFSVCLLANAITGFLGFVMLVFSKINGMPIIPPGPVVLMAILIEAPMIGLMLIKPPWKQIIKGVTVANLASATIAMLIIAPLTIPPPSPTTADDLALARGLVTVRKAIDEYHEIYGYYPEGITGGSFETVEGKTGSSDPLISSGLLESYPANPYAPNLRSRQFNMTWLLSGLGRPTRQVELDRPTNEWEMRWFPIMKADPRFGDPDHVLLCANGLSDPQVRESARSTFYHMNGTDYVPGCFFYKSYDFSRDGLADDYILGAYGWPTGSGTVAVDIIDGATGEICICLDSNGCLIAGMPDGFPEHIFMLYVAGTEVPDN